jgi:hypothetical protein
MKMVPHSNDCPYLFVLVAIHHFLIRFLLLIFPRINRYLTLKSTKFYFISLCLSFGAYDGTGTRSLSLIYHYI